MSRVHQIKERTLRDAAGMDRKERLNYLDERNDVEIRKKIKNFESGRVHQIACPKLIQVSAIST